MKRVHMICNAHIDPIWQWDWQEGASAALSTFRSAVKLAEKYDYVFCHNEVTVYKYAQEYGMEKDNIKAVIPAEEVAKLVKREKAAELVYSSAVAEKKKAKKEEAKEAEEKTEE